MGATRVGALWFGVGLLVATLALTVFPVVCTEVACPNRPPQYALEAVRANGTVVFTDGCNTCYTGPGLAYGVGGMAVGVLVGGAGVLREWFDRP